MDGLTAGTGALSIGAGPEDGLNRTPTEERLLAAQKRLEQAMGGGQSERQQVASRLLEQEELESVTSEEYRRAVAHLTGAPYTSRSQNETPSQADDADAYADAASTTASVAAGGEASERSRRESRHTRSKSVSSSRTATTTNPPTTTRSAVPTPRTLSRKTLRETP